MAYNQKSKRKSGSSSNKNESYMFDDIQYVINAVNDGGLQSVSSSFVPQGTNINSTAYLSYGLTYISSVSTLTDFACHLPSIPVQGKTVTIVNTSGISIKVFPSMTGGSINGVVNGFADVPSNGKAYQFICYENPAPGAWTITYPATNQHTTGSVEFLNSNVKFQNSFSAVAVTALYGYARLALTGTSGTMNINVNGVNYLSTFSSTLSNTASNFVSTHAAAILSNSGAYVTIDPSDSTYLLFRCGFSIINGITRTNVTGTLSANITYSDILSNRGFEIINNTPVGGISGSGKYIVDGLGGGSVTAFKPMIGSYPFSYVGLTGNPRPIALAPDFGVTWKKLTKVKIYSNVAIQVAFKLTSDAFVNAYTQGPNPTWISSISNLGLDVSDVFLIPGTSASTFLSTSPSAVTLQALSLGNITEGNLTGTFVETSTNSLCSANTGDNGTYYLEGTINSTVNPTITTYIGMTKVATRVISGTTVDLWFSRILIPILTVLNPDESLAPSTMQSPKFEIFYEYEQL